MNNKNSSTPSLYNPDEINKFARSNLEERIKRLSVNIKQDLKIANN